MSKNLKKLISFLFILLSLAIITGLGFFAPNTLFDNGLKALRGEGPAVLFFAMSFAMLVMTVVFLVLLQKIKRSIFAHYDRKAGLAEGPDEEEIIEYKTVGPPGRFERFLLKALIFFTVILCITGYGQYTTLAIDRIYWRMSYVHIECGAITVLLLIMYLFVTSRRRFSLRVCLLMTVYPVVYMLIMLAPGPLLAQYIIIDLILLPLGIYLLARKETPPKMRLALIAAALALFAFVLVSLTGFSPIVDPVNLRFSVRHRAFHAMITPIAILLPAFYFFYLKKSRGGTQISGVKILRSCALLIAIGALAGTVMHATKNFRLEEMRKKNTYKSAPLAAKDKEKFRAITAGLISDDSFCNQCHAIPFRQWARSVHANAARTVTFQSVVKSLIAQRGPAVANDCAACHDPEVALLNRPELLVDPAHVARSQGVSCRACHYMSAAGDKNALYALQIPRSDFFQGTIKQRKLRILVAVQEHVNDVARPVTQSGQVCFPCHSLRSMRKGHEQIPLDNVTSFLNSRFSKIMPCHHCHMPRIEQDAHTYSWMDHSFFGIQQELPEVIIGEDGLRGELARFTLDTTKWMAGKLPVLNNLEAFMDETFKSYRFEDYLQRNTKIAQTIKVASGGSHFSMAVKKAEFRGASINLVFGTTNVNVGHDFPSSLFANIVDVWFELVLTDAAGTEIYRSGFDPKNLDHRLGRLEVDADKKQIVPSDSFKYETIINWKFIEPGKEYADAYSVPVGAGIKFPVKARYSLKYKRYNDDFAKWFSGGKISAFPVRTVEEETFVIIKPGG